MRKNTKALFAFLVLACLALWQAPYANAQLLVYEGFDYDASMSFPNPTDGSLNGGIGWDGGWTTTQFVEGDPNAPPNPYQRIASDGLTYTDSSYNRLQVTGRAQDAFDEFWGFGDAIPQRDFDLSPTGPAGTADLLNSKGSFGKYGTTLWLSVLLLGSDQETFRATAAGIGFRDLNISGSNRSLGLGRPVALRLDGTYPPGEPSDTDEPNQAYGFGRSDDNVIRSPPPPDGELSVRVGSGVPAGITTITLPGEPASPPVGQTAVKAFMVLKLDFLGQFDELAVSQFGLDGSPGADCGSTSVGCGTNVSAWINPDLDADLANDPLGPKSGINFANNLNLWEISFTQITGMGGSATLIHDEFRIGATYADVAPIDTSTGPAGDFDFDGDVDGADFLLWQRDTSVGSLADWQTNFGTPANATAAVPEPSTAILLGMALVGGMVRRCWWRRENCVDEIFVSSQPLAVARVVDCV